MHTVKAHNAAPSNGAASIDESEFDDLVRSIEAQASHVRAQLANVEAEANELRARLRRFDGAIAKLKPQPRKARKSTKVSAQEGATKFVQGYLERHRASLSDGFTSTELHRQMGANGEGEYGKERVRYAVNELHERGILRLDRMTVGGGKLFKMVGSDEE